MQKGLLFWPSVATFLFFFHILPFPLFIPVANAQLISTFAGNGSENVRSHTAQLSIPIGVALDQNGNIYISDLNNNRIRKVSQSGVITTVAGNGPEGYNGDGIQATSARLHFPGDIVVDNAGNLYIADRLNNRIRKVSSSGVITTVAGNGTLGFSGDGGQATSAQLYAPSAVALDGSGNLYIADCSNNRIRKVTSSGVISTVAGNGSYGFSGDGGPATSAQLRAPRGVAVDNSGNIYIADELNHRIRKVSPAGTISTVAGTSTQGYNGDGISAIIAQLDYPHGVEVDNNGNLYIADRHNGRVRKVNSSGIITTVAGTGTWGYNGDGIQATSADLYFPSDIAIDQNGNLYIADDNNDRVRIVSAATGNIGTVAGTGTGGGGGYTGDGGQATSAQLNAPYGMAMDSNGNSYFADATNNCIRKVSPTGVISTVAGTGTAGFSGDGGAATSAQLSNPRGVAVDGSGNLYIADCSNNRIRKVTPSGVISTIVGTGTQGYNGDGIQATSAQLYAPNDIGVDGSGNLYIVDRGNHRIRKVTPAGIISTVAGTGTSGYSGDNGPATSAQLNSPNGLGIDGSGIVYIADSYNNRIRRIYSSGMIGTVAGNGTSGFSGDGGFATSARLDYPYDVVADNSGNLYIADQENHRVRKVSSTGLISTVAGTSNVGFGGDGGAATSARLYSPAGVLVDGSGNLYIADRLNNRIRKVNGPPIVSISPTSPSAVCWPGTFSLTATAANFTPNSYSWSSQPAGLSASGATPTFTIPKLSSATTYTITVVASDGSRTATSSVTLVVNEANSTGLITSGTLTCAQTSVNVTASGGGTYQFSGPGIVSQSGNVATVNVGGTYSVTTTAPNGCTSSASITVVSNTTAPAATLSASGTLTCAQTSVTLTAGGGGTYQFSGPGILSQSGNVAVVNVAGTYSVTVTGANGCKASQSITLSPCNPSCTQMTTLKAGSWTDPTVWSCGRVPVSTDTVQVNHTVSLPGNYDGQVMNVQYGASGQVLFATGSRLLLGLP